METDADFVGTWKLVSFEYRNSKNEAVFPFGEGAKGILIYTDDGSVSVHVSSMNRTLFERNDQGSATSEEIIGAFNSYSSYYGRYRVFPSESAVVHYTEGSAFPNDEGREQKRYYEFSGEFLLLKTPTVTFGDDKIRGVLKWRRNSSN